MKYFLGIFFGYIIHDAVQPTAVGKVLDKMALPADLFTTEPTSERPSQDPATEV